MPKLETALARHPSSELVVVANGASWIWDYVSEAHPEAVLDYYRAKQALWRYAKAHFRRQGQRLQWIQEQEAALFEDDVEAVIATIAGYGYRSLLDLQEQRSVLGYLRKNRTRMLYGSYRRRGLLIGSGPIVSAHRNIIQQRLKLAGQRWSRDGAQAIANLRALRRSGQWSALTKCVSERRQPD